jgi:dipeptidyl aminopeptidase/acylaminoacyl peptidase
MTESNRSWSSENQIHYPFITETALSPDGKWVVYGVRESLMTESESRFLTHLYLAHAEGGEPIQLTWGEHSNHHARWSPDGAFLAFLSDRGGKVNVYAMRVAGGEPWALTAFKETGIVDLKWSPDGQRLTFLMAEPPTEDKLAARKSKDDVKLWDRDLEFAHLFAVPFSVAARAVPVAEQITRGRAHVVAHNWMPDGKRLAVVAQPTPVEDDWTETRLYTVPVDLAESGEAYDVGEWTEVAVVASWAPEPKPSPDGRWIACVTGDQPPRWGGANRVVLYSPEGEIKRPLAATPDGQCWLTGWSADGERVYVGEYWGIDTRIWALPASGESGSSVLSTPTYKGAIHTPGNDCLVFSEETFHDANAVRVWSVGDDELRTVVAPPMLEAWPDVLPAVDLLRWQGPDGFDIEGMVSYPIGYREGTRCPLIVDVHGGPAGVFQRRFLGCPDCHCDVLSLAERGYAVLRVNPRGSSGYGCEFRFANYGDWGGGDYADILAGVDLLIERGIADPDRLGIMGWSYGGYMTSWVITQTARFRAACVGAGVTNLMSFTGTSDIPGFLPDYFGAEFWMDLEPYRQHSALFNVSGVATPTLIQHGDADERVPLSQGLELYNALKRQGVPVEMAIYPRQGHSMAEPRMRIDVRRRPVDWFLKWIGGEAQG